MEINIENMMNLRQRIFLLLIAFLPFSVLSCDNEDNIDVGKTVKSCIVIVPDIQNYTHLEERFKYLNAIADYCQRNKDEIDAILQVGDLTNNNQIWQYENAYTHFFCKFEASDQLVFCLGNHDYGNNGKSDIRMSNLPSYMMAIYDNKMEGTQWENYVRYITMGGKKYGVIVLEFCTRNEVLEWANNVIKNDPSTPYIIVTHVFLDQNGEMFDISNLNVVNKGSSHKKYQMGGDYKNDSREIFEKIIYHNPNVKLVVCGHCLTPSYINVKSENNIEGEAVYMIEVNYQHYTEGGLGYIGILNIEDDSYRIRSYSAYENKFGTRDISFGTIKE